MTLLRRLAALLILTALVAAWLGLDTDESVAPSPTDAGVIVPPQPPAWEPEGEPTGRDVLALIRDLSSQDPAVVLAAAKHLTWRELTNAEMERLVPLLWKALLADPDGDVNWDELRSFVGSAEMPALLNSLPVRMDPAHVEPIVSGLHRMIRADHLPLVAAKLMEIEEPTYRDQIARHLFGLPLEYTGRHRELAARTLHRLSAEPGSPEPIASGPGFPPPLSSALRRFAGESEALPTSYLWLARWIRSERPGPKDAELLRSVLERATTAHLQQAAERALGFLSDPGTLQVLRDRGTSLVAMGARARRGDKIAIEWVQAGARRTSEFLAVWLDVAPARAVADLQLRILTDDPDADRALFDLQDVMRNQAAWFGTRVEDRRFEGLRDEVPRTKLAGPRLALIGAIVPGCRTREIAERACALMVERRPPAEYLEDDSILSFLEVGAPDALRRMLRKAATAEEATVRDAARGALLRLGDAQSAELLVAYAKAAGFGDEERTRLAECGGPAVEAYLREEEDDAALAVCHGLPASLEFGRNGELSDAVVKLIRAGRPVDALVQHLNEVPEPGLFGIGRVRDERIRAWLERRRALRQDYAWATGELMLMGDEAAREETWAALTAGRYRWVDEADPAILTLDHDLTTIPHWIDDLESNCCRFNVVAQVFEELLGLPMDDYRSSPCFTAAEFVLDFWNRHGDHLVWSRIAGHFVPGAR